MKRPLILLGAVVALLAASAPAQPAKPSCTRGGAKAILTSGDASVVYVARPVKKDGTVLPEKFYGCWNPTGKRFHLFTAFLNDEGGTWDIIDGRYLGVSRAVSSGVSGQSVAVTWDALTRRAVHDTKPCNGVPTHPEDDESGEGVEEAVFFAGGGIAYTCGGATRIVDAKGDRLLEPEGIQAYDLTLTQKRERLFYMVGDTAKSLRLEE